MESFASQKKDIKSMTLDELRADMKIQGQPSYKALQIYRWLHRGVSSFEEMTDLSKIVRQFLTEKYYISVARVENKLVSDYDNTIKYLFSFADGQCVEAVLMEYQHGRSICISTQVGCKMGCTFCATGLGGFQRNLTASEMLSQVQAAQKDAGVRISNIVLMGMGEPLDNYNQVIRFLRLVSSQEGMNLGMRHISLSTCGLVPGIDRLGDLQLQLTLSVSLHAPDSETRSGIMPVNRAYDVEELFAACHRYFRKTGRRISFEYAMIDGVNDSDAQADLLAEKVRGMPAHINLIPLNNVRESKLKPSRRIAAFQKRLERHGLTVTVRRSLGGDIDASCGQLRRRAMEQQKGEPQ